MESIYIPAELISTASENLQEEIEKDLKKEDPEEENAIAKLIGKDI